MSTGEAPAHKALPGLPALWGGLSCSCDAVVVLRVQESSLFHRVLCPPCAPPLSPSTFISISDWFPCEAPHSSHAPSVGAFLSNALMPAFRKLVWVPPEASPEL